MNVVDVDNIIDEGVFVTPSNTIIALDVASDVTTSLDQPDEIKYESESASDNEKFQSMMATDDDDEEKVSYHEDVNYVFVGDDKDGSKSDEQSVRIFLLF